MKTGLLVSNLRLNIYQYKDLRLPHAEEACMCMCMCFLKRKLGEKMPLRILECYVELSHYWQYPLKNLPADLKYT